MRIRFEYAGVTWGAELSCEGRVSGIGVIQAEGTVDFRAVHRDHLAIYDDGPISQLRKLPGIKMHL